MAPFGSNKLSLVSKFLDCVIRYSIKISIWRSIMEITIRGWSRNMGTKVLTEQDLTQIEYRKDHNRMIWREKPGIFAFAGRIFVAWYQRLQHMGDYRMELELTADEL